jgi:hypothetical protein
MVNLAAETVQHAGVHARKFPWMPTPTPPCMKVKNSPFIAGRTSCRMIFARYEDRPDRSTGNMKTAVFIHAKHKRMVGAIAIRKTA